MTGPARRDRRCRGRRRRRHRAVPGGRVIAGHAVHAGRAGVRAGGDLSLERDPVPVTAVDARPSRDPRVGEQPHPVRRRELDPCARVVAGQDRVGEPRELGRARPDPVGRQRRGNQVGDDDRTRRCRGQEAGRGQVQRGAAHVAGSCAAGRRDPRVLVRPVAVGDVEVGTPSGSRVPHRPRRRRTPAHGPCVIRLGHRCYGGAPGVAGQHPNVHHTNTVLPDRRQGISR